MTRQRQIKRQQKARRFIWHFDYLHMRPLLKTLKESRSFVSGKLLDIGCGNRPYESWFSAVKTYIGLDINIISARPDLIGIGNNLPFVNNFFDTVLTIQTLEHVPNPWLVMAEIARVLKPGGFLILTAPQAWRVHERPHDYFRFTHYGLQELTKNSGLEVLQIKAQGGVWALVGQTMLNTIPHKELKHITAPINLPFNLFFLILDAIWRDERDTLNYLLLARKPAESPSDIRFDL